MISTEHLLILLEPFSQLLASSDNEMLRLVAAEEVFRCLPSLQESKTEDAPKFKVPFIQAATRLTELSTLKNVKTKNRKLMYEIVEEFKALQEQQDQQDHLAIKKRKLKKSKTLT